MPFLDNPAVLVRWLLLAVLLAPLLAAAAVAVSRGSARRVAAGFATYHVVATAALLALTVGALSQRGDNLGRTRLADRFEPLGVPGNTSDLPDQDGYETRWTLFELAPTGPQVPPAAVQFYVGLDGLNVWLVAMTSVMTLVAVLASWHLPADRRPGFLAWLFVLQTGATGAFVAFDVVLFYVFFELTLIPAFFLIGKYGVGGNRREAARTFVVYTLFGSLLTLAGLVGLVVTNPTPVSPQSAEPRAFYGLAPMADGNHLSPLPGPVTFSLPRLMHNVWVWNELARYKSRRSEFVLGRDGPAAARGDADKMRAAVAGATADRDRRSAVQLLLFALLVAGFAVKTPVVPLHAWLPPAYTEAPLGATLLFSAVLAKLGTYGMLRIVLPLCPDAAVEHGLAVFGTLGAVGIVYAGLCAYAQRDLKLLAAYSSVSHLGFVVLGLFACNAEGVSGAALHMVNHGLTAGGLFAVLAVLHDRYRTLDQNLYGGIAAKFPGFAVLTVVICLAGIGLPGLNSFVSEMLLMAAVFDPANRSLGGLPLAAAATAGLFLSAWYIIAMLKRVFFGPLREPAHDPAVAPPFGRVEWVALGLPAVLCLALGLFPQPVLHTMRADAAVLDRHLNSARERAGMTARPQTRADGPEEPAPPVGPPPRRPNAPMPGGPPQ
jgi:NADH-quinone oxidoreductase subunit M